MEKTKKRKGKGSLPDKGLFVAGTFAAVFFCAVLIVLELVNNREATVSPPSSTTTPPESSVLVNGNSIGSPTAPVTLVIYSDFQCHFCQQFALGIQKQLEATYVTDGKLRMIYAHIIAYGDESELAAEASECAAEQNQFWPYHDLLMQLRLSPTNEDLSIEKLVDLAKQLGLNIDTFTASLTSGKFKARVAQEDSDGRSLGFTGIPKFYFNGVAAEDSIGNSFENFQKVIDAELARLGK